MENHKNLSIYTGLIFLRTLFIWTEIVKRCVYYPQRLKQELSIKTRADLILSQHRRSRKLEINDFFISFVFYSKVQRFNYGLIIGSFLFFVVYKHVLFIRRF